MPIPRPPSPPNFSLPLPDPDDAFQSQPPLCTPVDQLILNSDKNMPQSPPSPIRTTVKRRRTSALTVMAAPTAFDEHVESADRYEHRKVQSKGKGVPKGVLKQPAYLPMFGNDEETRATSASQRTDLPDMSQDTLALFPAIVQEHHRMTHPLDANMESQLSFDMLPHVQVANQQRRFESARGQLAKVSLFNTLSSASSMENPFLTVELPKGSPAPAKTPHDKAQFAIRKVANASESFQNMGPVLDPDDSIPARGKAGGFTPAKIEAARKKEEKMKKLKLLLVASADRRRFRFDFELVRVAGKGAFSEVLQVKHRLDGCTYAIKKNNQPLLTDMARLDHLQEVFALSALQGHPNILRYHDAWFEEKGRILMLQTEFLPGGSLYSHYVENSRAMPVQELFALAGDMSSALAFMHNKGLAHLDVKPDNIFRCNRGFGRDSFIIGDFGLACHHDGTDARSTEGDSRYLCPEALGGNSLPDGGFLSDDDFPAAKDIKKDQNPGQKTKRIEAKMASFDLRRGDMFSLGATLYELAMGKPLAKSGPEWQGLRNCPKRIAKEVAEKCGSAELASIVKACLEPNPLNRATAEDVVERCKAHDTPEKSRHVEKLRQERDAAQRQCKRYDKATSALLKNGEVTRQRYRDECLKRSKISMPRFECL